MPDCETRPARAHYVAGTRVPPDFAVPDNPPSGLPQGRHGAAQWTNRNGR